MGDTETKVIQINSECGRGSTGKIAVAISKLLNEKNIENYIFYSGNHKSDYPNGRMIASKADIRAHQLLSRIFGDQGFHSYFATKKLVKDIDSIEPDVIILHNLHGYYLHLGVLFSYLKDYKGRVLWTLHDCWPFTGHCAHFTLSGCDKWKTGCKDCEQKDKYPYSWFFDRSKGLYNRKRELFTSIKDMTIITPSEWLAGLVAYSFLNKYSVRVINNGINTDVFKPVESDILAAYDIKDKHIILGVSSVWNNAKGLDVFERIATDSNMEEYKVVLVGLDKNTAEKLTDRIIKIERTQNQEELAKLYSAADVFVNPTREDNYPTVNMEAISCGTPVVCFDTGGCAEIVRDNGDIVEVDNYKELENAINQVCMNRIGVIDKAERFDEKKCFMKYIEEICS